MSTEYTEYKLSPATLDILANFCRINEQVILKQGTSQRTSNGNKNFIADVELDTPIPMECAIYNLNRLMGILSTCGKDDTSILFAEHGMTVKHQYGKTYIPFAHPQLVAKVPGNKFFMANQVAQFSLPLSLWQVMQKQASILDFNTLQIILNDDKVFSLRLVNDKTTSGTAVSDQLQATFTVPDLVVDDAAEPNVWSVKFDVLALMPGNYTVSVGYLGSDRAPEGTTLFGMVFDLQDPTKKVTYITAGSVVKTR